MSIEKNALINELNTIIKPYLAPTISEILEKIEGIFKNIKIVKDGINANRVDYGSPILIRLKEYLTEHLTKHIEELKELIQPAKAIVESLELTDMAFKSDFLEKAKMPGFMTRFQNKHKQIIVKGNEITQKILYASSQSELEQIKIEMKQFEENEVKETFQHIWINFYVVIWSMENVDKIFEENFSFDVFLME